MSEKKCWRHVKADPSNVEENLNALAAEGYAIKDVIAARDLFNGVEYLEFHIIAFNPEELTRLTMAAQAVNLQQQLLDMVAAAQEGQKK